MARASRSLARSWSPRIRAWSALDPRTRAWFSSSGLGGVTRSNSGQENVSDPGRFRFRGSSWASPDETLPNKRRRNNPAASGSCTRRDVGLDIAATSSKGSRPFGLHPLGCGDRRLFTNLPSRGSQVKELGPSTPIQLEGGNGPAGPILASFGSSRGPSPGRHRFDVPGVIEWG